MFRARPSQALPQTRRITRIIAKLVLGIVLATFLSNYQPALSFPPFTRTTVRAQDTQPQQTQQIESGNLPFSFQLPHPGYLSTPFSSRHPGIDIAAGLGMPVRSVAPGIVTRAGYDLWGLGLRVEINHGSGYSSVYGHLGKIYVREGQQVSDENILGVVGLTGQTTGPHTHLEIYQDGQAINPLPLLPAIRNLPKSEDFQNHTGAHFDQNFAGGRTSHPVLTPDQTSAQKSRPQIIALASFDQSILDRVLSGRPSARSPFFIFD